MAVVVVLAVLVVDVGHEVHQVRALIPVLIMAGREGGQGQGRPCANAFERGALSQNGLR